MLPMGAWHVLGHSRIPIAPVPRVRGNAAAAQLHLERRARRAALNLLTDVPIGHRVQAFTESDAIVDVHARLLPLR